MKKLLLATTVLVAGASVAAAEVALSGDARMGLINDFGSATDTTFTSRARVSFGLSGESESGLSFGASFRADNAGGAEKGTSGSVFIQGAFGKLSMGDVDGAANTAVGHVDGVGLTGLGDNNENLFIANGGLSATALYGLIDGGLTIPSTVTVGNATSDPSALYEYTAGSLSLYASVTRPGYTGTVTVPGTDPTFDGDAWSVGAAYSLDGYKFSIGYERLSLDQLVGGTASVDARHLIVGADATFGGITVKARYGDGSIDETNVPSSEDADLKQLALSATYTMDALSVTAFTRSFDSDFTDGGVISSSDSIGLGASYDLGGGAKVVGGVVRKKTQSDNADSTSETAADLGVSLSF